MCERCRVIKRHGRTMVICTNPGTSKAGLGRHMARIAGVNLLNQKRLEIGLTYIYGIGQSSAQTVCKELGLDLDQKVSDLTDDEVTKPAPTSTRTSRSRVTCGGSGPRRSSVSPRSAPTAASGTGATAVHGQRTKTNAGRARAPRRPSGAARRRRREPTHSHLGVRMRAATPRTASSSIAPVARLRALPGRPSGACVSAAR